MLSSGVVALSYLEHLRSSFFYMRIEVNSHFFLTSSFVKVMKKPSRFFIEQWLLTHGLSPEQPLFPSDPQHQVALPEHGETCMDVSSAP